MTGSSTPDIGSRCGALSQGASSVVTALVLATTRLLLVTSQRSLFIIGEGRFRLYKGRFRFFLGLFCGLIPRFL